MATCSTVAVTFVLIVFIIGFSVFLQPPNSAFSTKDFDVKDVGAVKYDINDISLDLMNAWKAACNSTTGQFKLFTGNLQIGPLTFQGPCKATTMVVNVVGEITAKPKNLWSIKSDTWIKFQDVQNLKLVGTGIFNGQGASWWNSCEKPCESNPTGLAFHNCNGLTLEGVTSQDSPRNHISINACNGATISNINIRAYKDSPNTDGIDISDSNSVTIRGGHIGTGDDCIAINGGSFNINITGVNCGPGHGISVGSLGRNNAKDVVSNINVLGATFTDTQNGVRIKTVPGGSGSASHITFANIGMTRVDNPIVLTQFYCPHNKTCDNKPQMVQISSVMFYDIHGTSATSDAINITCSPNVNSCVGITLAKIHIQPVNPSIKLVTTCKNANVRFVGTVFPPVVCARGADLIKMPLDYDYKESQQGIATS